MERRSLRAALALAYVALMLGATQLPATAQTNDPIRPITSGQVLNERAAVASLVRNRLDAPMYELAAERAETHWGTAG